MDWFKSQGCCWRHGFKKEVNYNTCIGVINNNEIFLILEHYNTKGGIKKYSIWLQDRQMVSSGGENFGVKIRNCESPTQGMRLCEQIYEEYKENGKIKNLGSRYFDDDILCNNINFFDTI